jgi:hypothetical protein
MRTQYHKLLTHRFTAYKDAIFAAPNVLKGWTLIHTYGIIIPFLHRNEMLTDEVNRYGIDIINITRCVIERVSDRSKCDINRNTRDYLPWFFLSFLTLFIRTKVPGSSILSSFFGPIPSAAYRERASSILRKEDRKVSKELKAHSHITYMCSNM